MKHQPVRQGQTTTPGTTCPILFDKCVGSLTSPAYHVTLKMQETGPTASVCSLHLLEKWQAKVIIPIYFGTKTSKFCSRIISFSSLESELSFHSKDSEINFDRARSPVRQLNR